MAFSMISRGAATDRERHLMARVRYLIFGVSSFVPQLEVYRDNLSTILDKNNGALSSQNVI